MPRGAPARHIARMIARRLFRFIRRFLFLVHHYQSEIAHRREHGAARADNDLRAAVPDAFPLVETLRHGKAAVQHGNAAAEMPPETVDRLRRQRNFRHHHDHAAPACKHMADGAQKTSVFPEPVTP